MSVQAVYETEGDQQVPLRNSQQRYGAVAMALHWLIFALFVINFAIAYVMLALEPGADKWALFDLHKSIGVTVLMLVLLRLTWRLVNPLPEIPAQMPQWQRRAASASHLLLYAVMIVMPISAYIGSKAGDFNVNWWGLVEMPDIVAWVNSFAPDLLGRDQPLHKLGNEVHRIISYGIYGLVGIHALAATHHHFVRRDDILRRMLPFEKMHKRHAD